MKRDAVNLNQLALFEPDSSDALRIMQAHQRRFAEFQAQAELWEACWCPGARDEALRQAEAAWRSWLVAAIYLDLEREFALGAEDQA